jgi:hypothetical protein
MKQSTFERLASVLSIAIMIGAVWFYTVQIGGVLELLELAAGG